MELCKNKMVWVELLRLKSIMEYGKRKWRWELMFNGLL